MKYFRKDSSRKILPQAPQRLGGLSKFSLRLWLSVRLPVVSTIEVPKSVGKMPLARGGPQPKGLCPELLFHVILLWTVSFNLKMLWWCDNHHSGNKESKDVENRKLKTIQIISSRPRIMQLGDEIPPNHPARALFISPLHDWKAVNLSCAMPYWLTSNSRLYVWVCVPKDRWIRLAWRSFDKGRI